MSERTHYDVAIVGASIGGCTAALLFARRGLTVALIERQTDPNAYKRICTHYIQPSATPTIQRLGIADAIERAGGIRNGVAVWTRWGWIRDTLNDEQGRPLYGYNIRRERLDPIVREVATGTAGVELMPGLTAHALLRAGGRFAGVSARGTDGRTREITARLVVGADGRHSRVAELAGVPTQVKPHNRFAYFAYYRNLSLPAGTTSQMWLLEPDVAYIFPNDDGQTIAAALPTKEKLPAFKQDIEGQFLRFFDRLPNAPRLRDADRVSPMLGMLDMPNISRTVAQPGLALVGDAALASDPLWGVGCGWAFQSAAWLVDATADAFAGPHTLDAALERYRKQHHAALAGHHFLISDFATGRPLNPIERLFMSAAVKDPVTAHHFATFGGRQMGVRQFLAPSAVARAAWVNLTHRGVPSSERPMVAPAGA
jgi:2-polyprenyl-6-methoxyphenol hydroxylase-like FAD-dependent oxidoreductase